MNNIKKRYSFYTMFKNENRYYKTLKFNDLINCVLGISFIIVIFVGIYWFLQVIAHSLGSIAGVFFYAMSTPEDYQIPEFKTPTSLIITSYILIGLYLLFIILLLIRAVNFLIQVKSEMKELKNDPTSNKYYLDFYQISKLKIISMLFSASLLILLPFVGFIFFVLIAIIVIIIIKLYLYVKIAEENRKLIYFYQTLNN